MNCLLILTLMNSKLVFTCHAPVDLFSFFKNGINELFHPAGPPVVRNNIIRNGTCAGGEIEIFTTWNYANIPENLSKMDHNIQKLEKYSGIHTSEFSPKISKEPMNFDGKFGVKYSIKYLTSSCDRVRLFVRKAVSWGTDISRARVRCECEPIIVLTKS
ncbi:unnamed protein product [Caenorhabditis angaria]|uniref:Glycosyltransferase family 92 protein n=1 Tax=Caenorhabditis angaria TaxID=860376 RepID=A0A9P1IVB7_9PELO|nr:unnamed protein product [Caenorhabditis angaria]